MRIYLLVLLVSLSGYSFAVDNFQETSVKLKHREAKDITPYLQPHLFKDGRISGQGNTISILSSKANIDELLVIIGDLDRSDYLQLIISITMNVDTIHNVNTRSIQVGSKTWTKINYGITYSNRTREKLENGNLVEKINYVKVIESFQIHTEINDSNKRLTLKLRSTQETSRQDSDESLNSKPLKIKSTESIQAINENSQIILSGKINEWISLADAIKSIYSNSDEDSNLIKERQKLTTKMAIKVQILQ